MYSMKILSLSAIPLLLLCAFAAGVFSGAENELTDPRDGKVYKTVKIGEQVWMAENLRYNVPASHASYCYKNSANNCEKYGRLYDWETAKKACPDGWRLPSKEDWEKLTANYPDNETAYKNLIAGGESGFNATLHGVYSVANNEFLTMKQHGSYWSSTDFNTERAWVQRFLISSGDTYESQAIKVNGHACRCLKN